MVSISPGFNVVSGDYEERLARRKMSSCPELWDLLDEVSDPEIPVLSLWDLGVLSDIEKHGDSVHVIITPTYSGCPAMQTMADDIRASLHRAGYDQVRIENRLSPAWTSGWLSPEGRNKMQAYGIAPPCEGSSCAGAGGQVFTSCPHCGSKNIHMISEFGSTACKALYQCNDCQEPFDYFKKI